ncbi:MAG: tRNA pseudouridine(55) synthase TruB [Sulfurospirillaceae bacterium]|nr:tRNA pseudouridine(55) synthase TruB [Sulfurospirillaceae bacterium]MDD2827631.1 tRNA pseudouridine(55) synthase TruB [Sulfurospirillaceae bacterium]
MENRLFVGYKPANLPSNFFLSRLKRKYGTKKAGFSGTLDPFAKGVLIIALGQFTKLFRFLDKVPKTYRATLWIGATSPTLDSEKIERVETVMPFAPISVEIALKSLIGEISYLPPRYSAKKIDGQRAYAMARADKEFELAKITSHVYDCKLIHYAHPFLTFEITISEGGYVRSMGAIIAQKLGFDGCLSALERLNEGLFVYDNEKALNPLDYLSMPENVYMGREDDIELGRVLEVENFTIQEEGIYKIINDEWLSIVEIKEKRVEYLLNKISLRS